MTSPGEHGALPEDLPVLTEIVGEDALNELPILSVVAAAAGDEPPTPARLTPQEVIAWPYVGLPIATVIPPEPEPEPEPANIIAATEPSPPYPPALTEIEIQQLLGRVEAHLTTVFAEKLSRHLEALQHQAVSQAMDELKMELPDLLRDALNTPDQP